MNDLDSTKLLAWLDLAIKDAFHWMDENKALGREASERYFIGRKDAFLEIKSWIEAQEEGV